MSNEIVEWRYFIASIAKYAPNNSSFFKDARRDEQNTIHFAGMRINARIRDFKQSIKNLLKGK